MSCEIIADGFHVHSDLYKLLLKDKRLDRIVLITDSLKPTEQKDDILVANEEEVVFQDGIFRRKKDDVIAGSALTMIRGIRNLAASGFGLEDAVNTASFNPAQIMHYNKKGSIIPGHDADLTVFDPDFNILAVMAQGKFVRNLF
jgi:N-acetylglucosamine-6-phosphate deacetylase